MTRFSQITKRDIVSFLALCFTLAIIMLMGSCSKKTSCTRDFFVKQPVQDSITVASTGRSMPEGLH